MPLVLTLIRRLGYVPNVMMPVLRVPEEESEIVQHVYQATSIETPNMAASNATKDVQHAPNKPMETAKPVMKVSS